MLGPPHIGIVVLVVSASVVGQSVRAAQPHEAGANVTSAAGDSWLKHIGRSFEVTSMGKTWRLGPSAPEGQDIADNWQMNISAGRAEVRALTGRDIYRLNCRGCHGESGAGFVPEINSLIDPVRATSPVLIMQRMKNVGMSMPRRQATELAQQTEVALLQRIHDGGENMPGFEYLSQAEVRSLVIYLKELAGVPDRPKDPVVRLSSLQIGERIVKSLCHTCHDAAGANPTPEQLESGVIPPLAALTSRKDLPGLFEKVTRGAPVVMGNPPSWHAGKMPVFDYLTRDEVADVYFYLVLYPPQQPQGPSRVSQPLQAVAGTLDVRSDPPAQQQLIESRFDSVDVVPRLLVISAIALTCFLLFGGLGITAMCMLLPMKDAEAEGTRLVQVMKHWKLRSRDSLTVMPVAGATDHERDAELGPGRIA